MTVRVLIVDDQEPFRLAARMVVELTDGFEVVGEAETGEDSVAMAQDLQPDLVLMDLQLPGIDGTETMRRLRQGVLADDVPVIALSALVMNQDHAAAQTAGFDGYLNKPISVRSLPDQVALFLPDEEP